MVGTLGAVTRPAIGLIVAAAGAVALGGCSAQGSRSDSAPDFSGEQRRVADIVEDLETAGGKSDEGRICSELVSSELARTLAGRGSSCATVVSDALKDTDAFGLTVRAVQISGTRATARVDVDTGDDTRTQSIGLVRERAGWRISSLGG